MRSLSFIIIFLSAITWVNAQSPHGKNLKYDCSYCHQPTDWRIIPAKMKFNHNSTDFKLTGQHVNVDCKSCHSSLVFSEAGTDCFSCHKDIHSNSVGTECSACHTTDSWIIRDINLLHEKSRFPLVGAHQSADCAQCHRQYQNLEFEVIGVTCFSCHQRDYYTTTAPNHAQANFSTECQQCHSINGTMWSATNFSHDFFPLTGGHKIQNCYDCHQKGNNFKGLSADCLSCHKKDYDATTNPDHASAGFSTDCAKCHTIDGFTPAAFDHNQSNFPLTGRHTGVSCQACHINGYTNTPSDCYSCHQSRYESASDPNHVALNYPKDCSLCHSTSSWDDAEFDHNSTAFPLTGAHASVGCSLCHSSGYSGTSKECKSCHLESYNQAVNPNHQAAGISTECRTCHTTAAWIPSSFNHASTGFQILGAHINLDCSSCHKGTTSGLNADCVSCHQENYNTAPNHVAQNYPSDCSMCHNSSSWNQTTFDHSATAFPLTGAHIQAECSSCHTNGFQGTSTDCYSCHETNFNNAKDPDHAAGAFPKECQTCHTTGAWKPASFDHNKTNFPLTGKHVEVSCSGCHSSGYNGTPTDCYSCHQSQYDNTSDPNHKAAGFPTNCDQCHSTGGWTPATFDHDGQYFPIYSGKHNNQWDNCADCHPNQNDYSSFSCVACHAHNQTDMNSQHNEVSGYIYSSDACLSCHPAGSAEGSFNHATSAFPLTGAHAAVQCSDCHASGYAGTSMICYDCHKNNYQGTDNPPHQTLALSTGCENCHTTEPGWKPALFPDHDNYYQIQGAHLSIKNNCADCHNGNYVNTPSTCYGCHQSDFDNTVDPPHKSANFPVDCTACHTQNAWSPSTFDHDGQYFPIYSGRHNGEWNTCADCHTNNSDYAVFSCITCHAHSQTRMDDEHREVSNYRYESTACYDCHPKGESHDYPLKIKIRKQL